MFAFDRIGLANRSRLGHGGMAHQAGLNLHRTETMATHLDYIVNTALDTQIAILIDGRSVTGKVDIRDCLPVGTIARFIAIDSTHQAGPGETDDQETALVRANGMAILIDDSSFDSWQRFSGAAGL